MPLFDYVCVCVCRISVLHEQRPYDRLLGNIAPAVRAADGLPYGALLLRDFGAAVAGAGTYYIVLYGGCA